jgi:hypothetical protein
MEDRMSLCPHGIRIEHKRCDRCEEIAEAEHRVRCKEPAPNHLFEKTHGDQELRVGWKDKPLELIIEGTPHALTLVQHLISTALSMTAEGNTVSAIHQKSGAKIIIRRTDIKQP